jgi:hypothetical protein
VTSEEREGFEREYRDWIRLMSRDAASHAAALPDETRRRLLQAYRDLQEPLAVFRPLCAPERVKSLAGERISSFIVLETDAVTFFPSVHSLQPGILDYAVAMNRRLFCRGLWYPIISLNSEYIRRSSDRLLTFALEHEFEMNRIYQEVALRLKTPALDEKSEIMRSALEISKDRLQITQGELIEDDRLMHRLSSFAPLLPKPYAERAMLLYLEHNLADLLPFCQKSRSPEEESFGEDLYREFESWSEFSQRTYELFVQDILCNIRDANQGYG